MNIIEAVREEIIRRSNLFEEQTKGTKDEYNLYREHIQYVYNYVKKLSKGKNIDIEVLEISALLHDISMTDINLDRGRHNEYSAVIAEEILKKYNYPQDRIEFVKKCILNHSSKRSAFRTTEEEDILVNADGLSHFDSIYSLYKLANEVKGLSDEESIQFVKEKLSRDYSEISVELRHLIEDKYQCIMNARSLRDILPLIIKIRKIVPEEFGKLRRIAPGSDEMWKKYKEYRMNLFNNSECDIYVIELNNLIIGEMTVNYTSHDLQTETIPNQRVYFEAFRLDKKLRGYGLGQLLIEYIINDLEKQGYSEFTIGVEEDNEVAKHIYFKYGFTNEIDRGPGNEFDPSEYILYMRSK